MKRILICLLAVAMSVSLFACGKNTNTNNLGNAASGQTKTLPPDAPTSPPSYDWSNVYSPMSVKNTFRVRFVDVAPTESDTGAVGKNENDILCMVDYGTDYSKNKYGVDLSQATTADKIVTALENTFVALVKTEEPATTTLGKPHIKVTAQENVKINDYDTSKSTGTYCYYPALAKQGDKETELYFTSYATYLADKTPIYVAAVDMSKNQSKKADCDAAAKAMIESLEEVK